MLPKVRQVAHLRLQVRHVGHVLAHSWPSQRRMWWPLGAPSAMSNLILALLGLILSPSCSKMARSCGNIAQHRAKIHQRGLQKHSHEPQRPLKVLYSHRFLGFRRFGRKFKVSQQDASKSAPSRHPKTTQRLATFKLASPQNLLQV